MKAEEPASSLNSVVSGNGALNDYPDEGNLIDLLPIGICIYNADGTIKKYNDHAVKLWGRKPETGSKSELFCGAFKLYYPDGKLLPHNETPVALTLEDGMPRKDQEMVVERPDLSRILINVNIAPLKDSNGNLSGIVNCFQEITRKKKTGKEADRPKNEFRDYLENVAIGIHMVDADGFIIWANKAELDMLGYTRDEYIGQHIAKFHIDNDVIDDILKRLHGNETLIQHESTLRCKDGSVKHVQINSNVLWEDDRFAHTCCFTVDVTEQRRLVNALEEIEKNYRQLIHDFPAPIYTTDAQGRVTMYNNAAAKLWGREPELGIDLWCGSWKIYRPDGSPLPLDSCPMAVALKEGRPVFNEEIIVERPDGSKRHVAPHPRPIFDLNMRVTGAINMLIDITEIKHTEQTLRQTEKELRNLTALLERKVQQRTEDLSKKNEELRKSEERYHKMIEEVEDYAILLLDPDGIIQNWNKGAEKIKGYREEEVYGKHFSIFYTPKDQKDRLPDQLIAEAVKNGKALHEGWRVRKDGTKFWGSIVITALHDSENRITGFSKVTRDLTERKRAEDKIKQFASELEFQNQELEQFAYAAAHDMKEPLRKILFYNSFVYKNGNTLSGKEQDYLSRSINAASRMQNLIDDLLAYSKASSFSRNIEMADLNKIFEDVLSSHHETIKNTNAVIEISELPAVEVIPFQFNRLFDNLISNSLKYRHPDRNPHIKITVEPVNGSDIKGIPGHLQHKRFYRISVIDNGIGFEQQYADKIFDLFERLHDRVNYLGSGIGLAICKKIIQNHKGYIDTEGRPGRGATFNVYIPYG